MPDIADNKTKFSEAKSALNAASTRCVIVAAHDQILSSPGYLDSYNAAFCGHNSLIDNRIVNYISNTKLYNLTKLFSN